MDHLWTQLGLASSKTAQVVVISFQMIYVWEMSYVGWNTNENTVLNKRGQRLRTKCRCCSARTEDLKFKSSPNDDDHNRPCLQPAEIKILERSFVRLFARSMVVFFIYLWLTAFSISLVSICHHHHHQPAPAATDRFGFHLQPTANAYDPGRKRKKERTPPEKIFCPGPSVYYCCCEPLLLCSSNDFEAKGNL